MRSAWDWHDPFGYDGGWSMATDERVVEECCATNCHYAMRSKGIECVEGQLRGPEDWHMPWGSDWDKPEDELKDQCKFF